MSTTMEELMRSYSGKTLSLEKGDQVEGEVLSTTDSEVILDLGVKSEGVLPKKDFLPENLQNLKVGDKLTVFVTGDTSSGLTGVSLYKAEVKKAGRGPQRHWGKFTSALKSKNKLSGVITEKNKGGFLVEVDNARGFLPFSQLSLNEASRVDDLVGKEVTVWVIEIDERNNKLIFTTFAPVSNETLEKLNNFQSGNKIKSKVVAVLPIGLVLDLDGVEGFVKVSDLSWEKVEDPTTFYKTGDEIEASILGVDKTLGRVNLSLKALKEDPFVNLSGRFHADDLVKGTIIEITQNGIDIDLGKGIQGFIPTNKIEGSEYSVGQSSNFLVDSVDAQKRRVNLAPFITSTVGLIYK